MKDFITTYGSLLTLVLLGIAYFIKRVFDLKTKKIEARHSLFQQNKIAAIVNFFSCYSKVVSMWNSLPIYKIINREIPATEIDQILLPLNELHISILQLTLYLDKEEIKQFELIQEGFQKINRLVSEIFFEPIKESGTKIGNRYHIFKAEVFKQNEQILDLIGKQIRQNFGS